MHNACTPSPSSLPLLFPLFPPAPHFFSSLPLSPPFLHPSSPPPLPLLFPSPPPTPPPPAYPLPRSAAVFHRAVIMPNLRPPVTTAMAAAEYRKRVLAAVPEGRRGEEVFKPLMTLYLTDDTTPEEVQKAKDGGVVVAFKLYPAGAMTLLSLLPPSLGPSLPLSVPPSLSPSLPPSPRPSLPLSVPPSLSPSLPPSLRPSLPLSVPPSLSPSLPPSLRPSLPLSVPPSLSPSLPPSLRPSLPLSVPPSLSPSLPPSLRPSLPLSVPPSLSPSLPPPYPSRGGRPSGGVQAVPSRSDYQLSSGGDGPLWLLLPCDRAHGAHWHAAAGELSLGGGKKLFHSPGALASAIREANSPTFRVPPPSPSTPSCTASSMARWWIHQSTCSIARRSSSIESSRLC
ncbi:unnamed protein product [Closterium sp. Naga37s-1]|nr:unnamed protein product [Closterium sp. Naga37s-1]